MASTASARRRRASRLARNAGAAAGTSALVLPLIRRLYQASGGKAQRIPPRIGAGMPSQCPTDTRLFLVQATRIRRGLTRRDGTDFDWVQLLDPGDPFVVSERHRLI